MLHLCRKHHKHLVKISTIIFDLGGVIINLDFNRTTEAFIKLTGLSHEAVSAKYFTPGVFRDFEKGLISDTQFRQGINQLFETNLTDQEIDDAWNAMLLELPKQRLAFIHSLRKSYQVLVLSNTNSIHEKAFNQTIFEVSGEKSLHPFVDQVYFSHELHLRKPNLDIYEEVLKQSGAKASESLFLDDTLPNLEGATLAGIQTMHITTPEDIYTLEQYIDGQ